MNLLVTCNEQYLPPLKTMLNSVFQSNHQAKFDIYFMHQKINEIKMAELDAFITENGHVLHDIDCEGMFEAKVSVNRYYSIEMYYRLLAPFILPKEVDRILYLDPDIINLNPFDDFYHQDFKGNAFIATAHDYITKWIQPINNIRLKTKESKDYFNTGVLLMNLDRIRESKKEEEILALIMNTKLLLLPDQDIFNQIYWNEILEEDWRLYNLDPRYYSILNTINLKEYNKEWVEREVVFIHYCGKHKPWNEKEQYRYELGEYYHFYQLDHFADETVASEE